MFRFRGFAWLLMALAALPGLTLQPAAAAAEAVPYTCSITEDGGSVRITVSNPARVARSCLVACQFQTPLCPLRQRRDVHQERRRRATPEADPRLRRLHPPLVHVVSPDVASR